MKARIRSIEGMTLFGETGSGHGVVMDAAPEVGGRNLGPRPMEMLLLGLGGCTAIDVLHILRKSREKVADCVVEIDADRAESDPKVFTRITLRYVVSGTGIKRAAVERAVQLSADKYCSASAILGKTASFSHEIEIVEGSGA